MMALGIGVGLPFGVSTRRPPQLASLRFWGRSADTSGADVATWTGRAPGGVAFAAAGGERPDASSTGLVFNGGDRMTVAAGTLGLAGATKATFAGWVKLVSSGFTANDCVFSSDAYPQGLAAANFGGTSNARWNWYVNGVSRNGTVDGSQVFDAWQFVCGSFDGSQATDDLKLQVYTLEHGQTVPTLLTMTGAGVPTALSAATGNAAIGDLPPFNRIPTMRAWELYAYAGAALTSGEALSLARISDPLAGKKSILPLGDSLVLGVGDGDANGGFRGDLITLAGSNEAFWYLGPTKNYTANAPNNRHAAVGGSKVDAHLTQFNAAVAAGWDPEIILYCGGRNDISAGEVASLGTRYTALFNAWAGRRAIVHTVVDTVPTDPNTATANATLTSVAAGYPNITLVTSAATGDADGVHPGAANYALMAAAYWAVLSTLL
jgi:lysophospholipase L1-like esterase